MENLPTTPRPADNGPYRAPRPPLRVGLKLFTVSPRVSHDVLAEVEVVKIGRKYFTCRLLNSTQTFQFDKSTWQHHCQYSGSRLRLYPSREASKEERDHAVLVSRIEDLVRGGCLRTLGPDRLRSVLGLIQTAPRP